MTLPVRPSGPLLPLAPAAVPLAPAAASLRALLEAAVTSGASDLHLRAGSPPLVRIDGQLLPLALPTLTASDTEVLVVDALPRDRDREAYSSDQECDFALDMPGVGRFRGNAYRARGSASLVLRHVREVVPSIDQLGLPDVVRDLAALETGLVLVAGPTGCGKSTTLAAMVDAINAARRCHILTIEDPIEYLHAERMATLSQREVHTDTGSFASALRSGLRQDPDVILVGEIRDLETLRTALQAAETGHLVLASLHARTAPDAVNRMIDMFPVDEQRQARTTIAESLQGVVSQRLVQTVGGGGRAVVLEVLVTTARVRDVIRDQESEIPLIDIIAEGQYYGMRTFQQDLVRLVMSGRVEKDAAEAIVAQPADFNVALKRAGYGMSGASATRLDGVGR
ncbi:MAG: PilT/PilU family type 4a pilus ATPase [Actinobacteria bacterium]|nr:PilT/PilU family type 4a pilus ATPase [Actinomycetota bacterium]